jgi:hypothetical protein
MGETISNSKSKAQFETKRILVTPELAEATLKHNKLDNRRINPVRVRYFVKLIKEGKFMCTHQGIALDDKGNILDGRHRLTAILESKCSVYMMVSKGVPQETMSVIDCNQPRTLLNRLTICGRDEITPSHIAIVRILEFGIVGASQAALGIEEAEIMLDKYADALEFVINKCGASKGIPAPVSAVIARAYYTKEHSSLIRFAEIYKHEDPENKSESAALKLKRKVLEMKDLRGRGQDIVVGHSSVRVMIYQLTESALYRLLKGEKVESLVPSKEEKFKFPWEK